jgi:WhiB family redox-sensing transcriptional regulator
MSHIELISNSPRFPNALCAKLDDKDFFFPDGKKTEAERLSELQSICSLCIHRKECLEYAIKEKILHGIWGGTTSDMRKRLFKNQSLFVERKGKARDVRKMHDEGKSPEHIASELEVNLPYVKEMIRRYKKMKMKGAIQSNLNIENLQQELRLSSGLAQ